MDMEELKDIISELSDEDLDEIASWIECIESCRREENEGLI